MLDQNSLSDPCFECAACSFCCSGSPGFVWLGREDLDSLLEQLGLGQEAFIQAYCRWVETGEGRALSLLEIQRGKNTYDCVFLDQGRCSVYPARPLQCRTYPFWKEIVASKESWEEEARSCPGIGKGSPVPAKRIEAYLTERHNHRKLYYPL
ncbi:MAG: YkgJ family cysteine cluster protein [Spirochaetia bacterium]|jgi:Fe-S-cluster containining protein|nr:YkgJ family cysteine cluster protein [Spirochaetia bacterium]